MKKIIAFSAVVLLLAGCEPDPQVNPNADWKIVNIQTDIDLHKVFFVNSNVGFVAGTAPYVIVNPNVVQNWGNVFTAMAYVNGVHIITDSSRYYYKTFETMPKVPEPSFFKTTDGGNTWENVVTPFITTVTDIFFLDESYGFVATSDEGVYKTTNGGQTWQKVLANVCFLGNQHILENPFSKVYFINKNEGFAFNDVASVFVKTIDGGKNWTLNSSFLYSSAASSDIGTMIFPGNSPVGYGLSRWGKMSKTENNGDSWNLIQRPVGEHVVADFSFLNESIGFSISADNTYMTEDGGVNWQRKNLDGGPFLSPERIFCLNENEVYILDGSEIPTKLMTLTECKVYYSNNSGAEYSEMSMQHKHNQANIKDWFFLNEVGFLVGENGLILKHQPR